jgi:hypothetical protein
MEEGKDKVDKTTEKSKFQQQFIRKKNSVFVSGSRHTDGQYISPSFDHIRGLSPEFGSYNNLSSFLPSEHERPRLSVLQNFKDINRMLRSNFLQNKSTRKGLPTDELALHEKEDEAVNNMTKQMKHLVNHSRFQSPLRKAGTSQNTINYMNLYEK